MPSRTRRTDDGIRHAAARLACRLRNLGEEIQVQRAGALYEQVDKDRDQRRNHQDRRQHRQTGHA